MPPILHCSQKRDGLEIQKLSRIREQCGMGGINEVEVADMLTLPADVWRQVVE